MSKKKRQAHQKIAKTIMSVFVLAVVLLPLFTSFQFVKGLAGDKDPRKTTQVAALQPRTIDQTAQPLAPFAEPVVTITFDDGWESVYTKALPVLQTNGFHTTHYIITDTFSNHGYMSLAQLHSLQSAGHDIAAHTISHADLTMLDDQQLKHELYDSQQLLDKEFGVKITDFTSPYGAYNAHTLNFISKYYRSQKNAEGDPASSELEAINTKANFDPMNFVSYSIRKNTKLQDIQKLLDAARTHNGWLVLTYHQIDSSNEEFAVTPDQFAQQMKLIGNSPLRSATVNQVINAYTAQQGAH
ncbi:MAG: polysaccharide deacetylase [Candidatus Saccharibacteria bacterium]|nr:polysaccharide deacetylase [Candidatus Saccharibacteria bacterium]